MPLLSWKNSYSVNVRQFDDQHKVLFDLLNELYDAMQLGKGRDRVRDVISNLVRYTREHFSAEENAMRYAGYPEYPLHKQEHDAFTSKVLAFEADFEAGKVLLSVDLMNFLRDWLTSHILKSDKRYAPFMKA